MREIKDIIYEKSNEEIFEDETVKKEKNMQPKDEICLLYTSRCV